jgi:hypothetical protein
MGNRLHRFIYGRWFLGNGAIAIAVSAFWFWYIGNHVSSPPELFEQATWYDMNDDSWGRLMIVAWLGFAAFMHDFIMIRTSLINSILYLVSAGIMVATGLMITDWGMTYDLAFFGNQ